MCSFGTHNEDRYFSKQADFSDLTVDLEVETVNDLLSRVGGSAHRIDWDYASSLVVMRRFYEQYPYLSGHDLIIVDCLDI